MSRPEIALPPSLPEHIRRLVETDIVIGLLEPNIRVTEEQFASRYSVSRTPVREAMRLLENQGLLVRRKGAGVFVAARTTRDETEVVYRVRRSVEGFLTERAARAMTGETLAKLQRVHDDFRERLGGAGTEPDISALVSLDSRFHWAIYDASGSDLTGVVTSYWGLLQRELCKRLYEPGPPAACADQHTGILEALKKGDAAAARDRMSDHLERSSDAVLATYDG